MNPHQRREMAKVLIQLRNSWLSADRRQRGMLLLLVATLCCIWLWMPGEDDYAVEWLPTVGSPVIEENVRGDSYDYIFERNPGIKSRWELSERERFKALLVKDRYDVIVVPFQVEQAPLDRATRSYMAMYLAEQILQRSGYTVADPHLVARALGDGQRHIPSSSVYQLAHAVGARLIIWGHAAQGYGSDRDVTFQFKVKSGELPIDETTPTKVYKSRPTRDDPTSRTRAYQNFLVHPAEEYPPLVSDLLPHLPIDLEARATQIDNSNVSAVSLSRSPVDLVRDDRSLVQLIYDLHLLALLTPKYSERLKDRFAEKAMLALSFLESDIPEYRILKARTLMMLGVRPAALKFLGEPQTIEEEYYTEYLNGNLPAASQLAARPTSNQARLIANLELAEMAVHYGKFSLARVDERVASLDLLGTQWEILVRHAMVDHDLRIQFDNKKVLDLLNSWYPSEAVDMQSLIVRTSMARAENESDELSAIHDAVRRLVKDNPDRFCCDNDLFRPSHLDLLDLLDAMATGNLARQIEYQNAYQRLPDASTGQLDRLERIYEGHPVFTMLRAQTAAYASHGAEGAARDVLERSAYANALRAYFWSRGQSHVSLAARHLIEAFSRGNDGHFQDVYESDYPLRAFYARLRGFELYRGTHQSRDALRNSAFHTYPVRQLNDAYRIGTKPKEELVELLGSIEGRFDGSLEVAVIRAEAALDVNDYQTAESAYRQLLVLRPHQWAPYEGLTKTLLKNGRADEAASVAMSYPGFSSDSGDDSGELASRAYSMGSELFLAGKLDAARAFYEVAAMASPVSYENLASEARLRVLDQEFGDSLESLQQWARNPRSHSADTDYPRRDFLSMLHASGYSKGAWDGFNLLLEWLDEPHLWESALVGHRISATSDSDLIAWASQEELGSKGEYGNRAARNLLRAAVTDRVPSAEMIQALADIDAPVWGFGGRNYRRAFFSVPIGHEYATVGPHLNDHRRWRPPPKLDEETGKQRTTSDLVYFAQAYKALRERNYTRAQEILDTASRHYFVRGPRDGYVLPYMAFAAAKSGNTKRTLKMISIGKPHDLDFDYYLAHAVLKGLAGQTDQAVEFLHKARRHRPLAESRPVLTEYQYGEITEWLYKETGAAEFRDIALEWARLCQQSQPWHAWAYAMEANLSDDSPARRRAIAMAHYLDPNSERLNTLPISTVEAATVAFGNTNPFRQRQQPFVIDEKVWRHPFLLIEPAYLTRDSRLEENVPEQIGRSATEQ
jgi:hypothetical protein